MNPSLVLELRSPPVVFVASLLALWLVARVASTRLSGIRRRVAEAREDFDIVLGATLTLLALIIGFTFSMALGRYDQRMNDEEAEANAIGTEYLRADLLPSADAARVKALLREYLEVRIATYATRDAALLRDLDARTARLGAELWSAVRAPANAQPTPVVALAVAGMNDVLNSAGYTQAAWNNRIPTAAWLLLVTMAVLAVLLVGLRSSGTAAGRAILVVLPLVIATAFVLIADIDSPRRGLIHVAPQNMSDLLRSLPGAPAAPGA